MTQTKAEIIEELAKEYKEVIGTWNPETQLLGMEDTAETGLALAHSWLKHQAFLAMMQ